MENKSALNKWTNPPQERAAQKWTEIFVWKLRENGIPCSPEDQEVFNSIAVETLRSELGAELREYTSPPDQRNIRRIADGLRRMRDGDRSGPSAQHMLEWAEQEIVGNASPRIQESRLEAAKRLRPAIFDGLNALMNESQWGVIERGMAYFAELRESEAPPKSSSPLVSSPGEVAPNLKGGSGVSAPQPSGGKWAAMMATALPCGHTNAQHLYAAEDKTIWQQCEFMAKSEAPHQPSSLEQHAAHINGQREVFRMYGSLLREIPVQNAQGWNRYDTDNKHVLHVWSDGKSYDIHVPKDEYLPSVRAGKFVIGQPEAPSSEHSCHVSEEGRLLEPCDACGKEKLDAEKS